MVDHVNQHFVPQFYFKLFTRGDRRIHFLFKKKNQIILNASIRGQCAHHGFYGSREIESFFSKLEIKQSIAIRKMLELVWFGSSAPLNINEIALDMSAICNATIFQHARTELQIKKESPAIESMYLECFKNYLKHSPNIENREHFYEQFIEHVAKGNVHIKEKPQKTVMRSISVALERTSLIADLNFYILRNYTEYPFVFGDSPVIFYNTYYQNVKDRGVLGLQTPGLQIFYPLDSDTMLMLIDDQIYGGWYKRSLCVDLTEKSDVSQINALQLHHSFNSVYFADENDKEYISDLWNAHKHRIIQPEVKFVKRDGWLVDGKPVDGILYQTYEPQLNIKLNLSFIECTPIRESEYKCRNRSPELVKELEKRIKKTEKDNKTVKKISI